MPGGSLQQMSLYNTSIWYEYSEASRKAKFWSEYYRISYLYSIQHNFTNLAIICKYIYNLGK